MMEQMRSKAAKLVVWVLSIFLIASFGLWGIGDMFRGRTVQDPVAEIGDLTVPGTELREEFSRIMENLRSRMGASFDMRQAVQLGLLDETLDRIVNGKLISLEASRLGLGAGEPEIAASIRNSQTFKGPTNEFEPDRFRVFLREQGLSEAAYVGIVRSEIMRDQLTGSIVGAATAPKSLVALTYRYRNEQRVVEFAVVPPADAASLPDPDPATLAAFHKDNAGLFTAPEYRKATVLYLNPADAAKEVTPPEERLKEEYEHRLPQISVPERRKLRQILLQDEAKAKEAAEAVKTGKPFDEAAKEFVNSAPVELGELRKRDLPGEIAEAAFAAAENAVAGPVKSPLGWHLIQVAGITAGKTPTFEQVRQTIRDDVAREMAVDALIKLTAQIDDSLAGGASLEATAETINGKLLKIEAIDAQARDRNGNRITGIPTDARFMKQLFTAPIGELGTLEETDQGGFFLIRVDASTPPALRPLDEVRSKAITAWKATQLGQAAKKKADTVAEAARQAGNLGQAARTAELTVTTSKPFTRFIRDPSSPVPDGLASAIFKAKVGEIVVDPADKGFAVGQLKEIIAADPSKNEAERKQLEEQLQGAVANDMLAQFLGALKTRFPVKINRKVVDALVTNDPAY
jgi:peptidyl-prolyl cis-trans isomerase D